MLEDQKCALCQQSFTSANIAWIMSECMHNICNRCLKKSMAHNVKQIRCLECKTNYKVNKQSLEEFPKNITIFKRLKEPKLSLPEPQINQSAMLLSTCSQISMRTILTNCIAHSKPLDIICTNDRELLCAHCAIFGAHQNHTFKTVEQFETSFNQIKDGYRNIDKKKQICDETLRSKKYRSAIINKISQRKDRLVLEAKNKFVKLYTAIKDAQKQLFDDLAKNLKTLQSDIGKVTKQEQNAQKKFNQWKNQMDGYIREIECSEKLKQKIDVFYRGNTPNLLNGEKLLAQLQTNNEVIKTAVNQKIDSIQIQYANNIEGYIYNFAKASISQKQLKGKDQFNFNPIPQFDQLQQSKRTITIQFIKSTEIDTDDKTTIFGKSNQPNILNRVKSDPKLIKTHYEKIDQVKRPITPQKCKSKGFIKHEQNLQNANKMVSQFLKSTDTLDISGLDLTDDEILQIVTNASNKKQIKCIKICKNKLTNQGLSQLLSFIPYVTNINLSYNLLTDSIVNIFIDNREILPLLRIINFSHNKINERKIKTAIDELKRVGIITIV